MGISFGLVFIYCILQYQALCVHVGFQALGCRRVLLLKLLFLLLISSVPGCLSFENAPHGSMCALSQELRREVH